MPAARTSIFAVGGSVLSAAAVLVSVTIVVQTIRNVSEQNTRDVAELSAGLADAARRIGALEQSNLRAEERHEIVVSMLRRLDERLQRIEPKGDP